MALKTVSAALAAAALLPATVSAAADTKYLISFGDSYSQTGFEVSGTKPSAANPLGNPPLPGWTASGGLNWVGSVVTEFNSSLTLSYNFAYGGATTDSDLVAPYDPSVRSFIDQVEQFSNSIAEKPADAPWTAENALAGVWIGVNDVGNSYWQEGEAELLAKVLDVYFKQVQVLYDAGLRKFALLSVPPTQLSPMMIEQGADAQKSLATAIDVYNDLLTSRVKSFTEANEGATAKVVDTAVAFNTAIKDPKSFGAPDATCFNEDGVSCLWFNNYHPAVAIEKLVAAQVAKAWDGFFECRDSVICES